MSYCKLVLHNIILYFNLISWIQSSVMLSLIYIISKFSYYQVKKFKLCWFSAWEVSFKRELVHVHIPFVKKELNPF